MSGPWERYKPAAASKPWERFAPTVTDTSDVTSPSDPPDDLPDAPKPPAVGPTIPTPSLDTILTYSNPMNALTRGLTNLAAKGGQAVTEAFQTSPETYAGMEAAAQQPDKSSALSDLESGWSNLVQAKGWHDVMAIEPELARLQRGQSLGFDTSKAISSAEQRQENLMVDLVRQYKQEFDQNPTFKAIRDPSIPGTPLQKTWAALRADPYGAGRSWVLQSAAVSLPSVAGGIAGAPLGPAGSATGAGLGSYYVESGLNIVDELQRHGADLNDPESVKAVWRRDKADIMQKAQTSGAIVGMGDAISGGLSSKIAALGGRGLVSNLLKEFGGTFVEGLGGSSGEIAKQYQRDGQVTDWQAPIDEFMGEVGSGAVQQAGQMAVHALKGGETEIAKTPPRQEPRLFDDLPDAAPPAQDQQTQQDMQPPPAAPVIDPGDALLAGAGWTPEQIGMMSAPERDQAIQEAQDAGVTPAETLAPGAPEPGTAAMAPRGTRKTVAPIATEADLEAVRPIVNAEPSDAQKEAGNYKLAHVRVQGLDVSIETPKGVARTGKDPDTGKPWTSPPMPADYGYFKRSEARDGDHVDVFIGPDPTSPRVFVIDQKDLKTGRFDEPKVIVGARSHADALRLYQGSFSDGRAAERVAAITETNANDLKQWLSRGPVRKPFAKTDGKGQAIENPNLQQLASDEEALPQSQGQELPGLRREGDRNLPAMGGQLRGLSGGYGGTTEPSIYAGPQGQQQGQLSGQLPVGDGTGAVQEPAGLRQERAGQDGGGSGGRPAIGSRANTLQSRPRRDGPNQGTDQRPLAIRSAAEVVDDRRNDPVRERVGAPIADEGNHDTRASQARLDRGAGADPARQADAALDAYLSTRQPLTAEALATRGGMSVKDAGKALQRAALAGRIMQGRNGQWRRLPSRVKPVSLLSFVASIGGIQDVTGELAGMDLPKMTEYGPPSRRNGLHPDKVLEAAVEAGYLRDPGRDNGTARQLSIRDLYDAIDREVRGAKVYTEQDQPAADGIEAQRKNEGIDPEWRPMHPMVQRYGQDAWDKAQAFLAENGSSEESWAYDEIANATRLISEGMQTDAAFERAAFLHVETLGEDLEDIDPAPSAAFRRNDADAMTAFEPPPFPDVEPVTNAEQPAGSQEASPGVSPSGQEGDDGAGPPEDAGAGAQVPGAGPSGGEEGQGGSAPAAVAPQTEQPAPKPNSVSAKPNSATEPPKSAYPANPSNLEQAIFDLPSGLIRQIGNELGVKQSGRGKIGFVEAINDNPRADVLKAYQKVTGAEQPASESGADNKPQMVIPGAEQLTPEQAKKAAEAEKAKKELEIRRKQSKLRKSGQESVEDQEGGLFGGSGPKQSSILDTPEQQPAADDFDAALTSALDAEFGARLEPTPRPPRSQGTKTKPASEPQAPNRLVIQTGVVLRTKSGRETSPAPKIEATSDRKTNNTLKRMHSWLLEEARKEVEGDEWQTLLLKGMDVDNLSQSDQDHINLVLFDDPQGATDANVVRVEGVGKKSTAPKTAGEAAASAVKNTAMSLDQATKGLMNLFGGNKLSSGFTFDEDTYAAAKPYFKAALAHLKEAGKDIKALVAALVAHLRKAGMDRDGILAMSPYMRRFTDDVVSGKEAPLSSRGRLSAAKAPIFYSGLLRAVENLKQEKAPAAQWLGTIRQTRNRFRFILNQKQAAQLTAEINQIAADLLGHHLVGVETRDTLEADFTADEDAVFDPNTRLIWVALRGTQDPRLAVRHEAIHALRHAGVFTAKEWAVLTRVAQSHWMHEFNIRERYESLYRQRFDLKPEQIEQLLIEEAIAEAFADHLLTRPQDEALITRIFNRVMRFIEAVRNLLAGHGYTTADQVLQEVETGAVGRRRAGQGQARQFPLSARQDSLPQAPLSSRGRLRPPRNPAAGSFDAPHDERMMRALNDTTDTLLGRLKRAGKAFAIEGVRKLQDREVDLLRTQNAITKASGSIAESKDAYLAASLYPGRVAQKDKDLLNDVIKPLVKDIAARGLSLREVDDFVRARHGIERNLVVGQLYKPGEQFHDAMTNPALKGASGLSEDEITQILDEAQNSGKLANLEAVGNKIVALNARSLRAELAEGLITQELYDQLTTQYRYYVPLRGWDEATSDAFPEAPRTGSRFDIRGKEHQQAFGRTTLSDSPLAFSILQARQAIIRIEKNRVAKRFLRLAQANPNEAFWQVERRDLKKVIDKGTGLVRRVYDRGSTQAENVFAAKVGGQTFHVTLHHDGLLRAMKGIGTANMHDIVGFFHKINRYLAAINTSLDPEFIFRNFLRDLQHAGIVLQEEKQAGLVADVIKSVPKATAGVNRMLKGDLSTPWARMAREFADAGGKVGFMDRGDIDAEKRNLDRLMKSATGGAGRKTAEYLFEATFGRIERYNDAIENTLRLATYAGLRNRGVSKDKAAFVARELTVNFNRKGEWGPFFNAFYLFFNASMQGGAQLAVRLKRSKRLRIVAAGIVGAALVQDIINRMIAGDDDDDKNRYDKIPDDIKARFAIIMMPKWIEEKYGIPYFKWPLPLGWNMFHVIGTQAGHVLMGARTPLEGASNMVGAIGDAFNPLGSGGFVNWLAPTLMDPAIDLYANTDFWGDDIVPKTYDDTKPLAERYNQNVTPGAKMLTDTLSKATGGSPERPGSIDVSPEQVEYLWDFATGGVGRLLSRAWSTGDAIAGGDAWDAMKTPFVRVFVGQDSKYIDRDEYYQIKNAVEITQKELKGRTEDGDAAAVERVRRDHAPEVQMIDVLDKIEKRLAKLRKEARKITANDAMPDDAKKTALDGINAERDRLQQIVRKRWNQIQKTTNLEDAR